MLEQRSLRLDLIALALFALVVFLALALATYHPADPLVEVSLPFVAAGLDDVLVHPQREQVGNACGQSGAITAKWLLTYFGRGAYYLVLSLAVLDALLLMRRPIDAPVLRLAGWLASLAGLTAMLQMLLPGWSAGPVVGSGGYLGLLGRAVLEIHFAAAGSVILAATVFMIGLLLCTDYALVRLARWVVRGVVMLLSGRLRFSLTGGWARQRREGRGRTAGAADEVAVRIRGRKSDIEPAAEAVADESAAETEELVPVAVVSQRDPAPAAKNPILTAVRNRLTPRLKVRKPDDKIDQEELEEVVDQLEAAATVDEPVSDYHLPSIDLLLPGDNFCYDEQEKEVRQKARILEKTFADFGFNVKVVEIETGPVIAQYEVELEAGLRLSKITGLADDLAIALRVPSVRIVAPIPGKNTVGIEVPNRERQVVRLREIMEEVNGRVKKMRIPLFLGKDVSGNPLTVDLSTLPHLLIAGRTGTGKSVCLNAIISSILMTRRPDEVRMLMIDPKMVELSCYKTLPHLMHPVVTDMRKAEAILAWAVEKMEERYELLARAGVRHLAVYNQLGEEELMQRLDPQSEEERRAIPLHLPYIVVVADEMADLMMTAGKEVEQHIIRLAQKSRAVGIHLILATQKPTVDVITGLIKSNLPARIAFQVASRTDSRVVLDEMGADKLLGNGDMLFLCPGTSSLLRGQGTYLSDDEINAIVEAVSTGEQHFVKELVQLKVEEQEPSQPEGLKRRDELYEAAVDIVVREGRGSVSLLQRGLGIGYGRAARLIDFMAEDGIVGPYAGSQAREVMISLADWERMQAGGGAAAASAEEPPRRRTNKILPLAEQQTADAARPVGGGGPDIPFDVDLPQNAGSAGRFDEEDEDEAEDDYANDKEFDPVDESDEGLLENDSAGEDGRRRSTRSVRARLRAESA